MDAFEDEADVDGDGRFKIRRDGWNAAGGGAIDEDPLEEFKTSSGIGVLLLLLKFRTTIAQPREDTF